MASGRKRLGGVAAGADLQLGALAARRVEIVGREEALEPGLYRRPVAVGHGEPGGVAIAPRVDHVLAQDPLVEEAEAQSRAPRRRVERVALPLEPAVAELVEDVA